MYVDPNNAMGVNVILIFTYSFYVLYAFGSSKKKFEKLQSNTLMMFLWALEKQGQTKDKNSKQKEMTTTRAEIKKTKMKDIIQRINKRKSWFFQGINKTGKPLDKFVTTVTGQRLPHLPSAWDICGLV